MTGKPSPKAAQDAPAASTSSEYYAPTWADASGRDGKGGVKLEMSSEKRLPLVPAGFDKQRRGDAATAGKSEWLLFHGPGENSLLFDFTWITTASDKFFSNTWAGGGVAFNSSWGAVDATDARYLVLWVKSSVPGVNLSVRLHSTSAAKGKEDSGKLELPGFISGGRLDDTWRRVVVPLSAFPDIAEVDLKGLQQVAFDIVGGYPENQRVSVWVDDIYVTNLDLVTPVTNPGFLVEDAGIRLQWDKDAAEKVRAFDVSVDGKPLLAVEGQARTAWLSRAQLGGASRVKVGIVARGERESSEPVVLDVATGSAPSESASVSFAAPTHDISPYIFGTNWGPASSVRDLGVTVRRWGGNRTTKYNWVSDVDSAGADWFFLNGPSKPAGTPEEKKSYYRFIKDTLSGGAQVNFVIPISDFIAKPHPNPTSSYCSYPISLFPKQEKTDGQGCGNGRLPNGQEIWDNDPTLGMTQNSPELQRRFVESVVKLFGPASKGGVGFYTLDNEPGLWMHTHRDALPRGISAAELADLDLAYAKSVKAADPTAKVLGFGAWGVLELAGSNVDHLPKGPDGYKHHQETTEADRYRERKEHGGDSQLVYLLKRFKQAEAQGGVRLIDALDIHWYPELYGNTSKAERHRILDDVPYDSAFAKLQWAALREWYDPTFQASPELDSWTAGANTEYLWSPYHPVIPSLKKLIDTTYPGTKLAINEYDNGSTGHYHGALLRAAALGIFMQEDLYMAQNWAQTDSSKFVYFAQKLYGNFDGRGGRVRGKFVPSTSTHADLLSYAARDGARFTVVLINKNPEKPITTTLELPVGATEYRSFTLAESLGLRLLEARGKVQNKRVTVTLPAYAALLVTAG